ncbi:nitrogen permease regulator of amino acid transport activity 3-domain-containing protein [Fimicolochytrium jonesii]|uniref:nitrogen permease regulator of amino acid transport activity 3-domain-containing protein n=1 Tax=Fimicolochytrium jonesii TaxID=1396493 RepID=UPI0022FDC7D2|nr:nitrogen permease regulator of amino acid transport activity 3-domain-containing protein [Fimicolochytrium jonesii]KAI8818606.1 nitrogen permease regulator of amino acid transport activity 3-domain-containing protein [Fimicolochytrium jonesii]
MSPFLGILLICYSSRGHQLVFNYPAEPKPRLSRTRSGNRVGQLGDGTPLRQQESEKFLGFETHFLSDVLSPKVALCDRQFQLTVDDVTFVGHPTLLHADRPGTGHRFARMIQKKRLNAQEAGIRTPSSHWDNELHQYHDGISPPFEKAASNPSVKSSADAISSAGLSASAPQLSMFNLVFAMQTSGEQMAVDEMYTHVISKVTAALKYEQLKRGYIRKETELILSIKDDAQNKTSDRVHLSDIIDRILSECSLARCLADIYDSIVRDSAAHVVINSSVDLSLHLPKHTKPCMLAPQRLESRVGLEDEGSSGYPVLRPYHAILLLYDPEEVLQALPVDPLPLLAELIQVVTPTQCFQQLQATLDCSLSQVYRLAAHLVHWQKAKIIHVVGVRNVYVVPPNADLNRIHELSGDFNNRFPSVNLPSILANLTSIRPFSTTIPQKELRTLYLEILTYLLRHNLVEQLHMYIYLMIPYNIFNNKLLVGTSRENETPSPVIIADPAQATDVEREWINRIAYEQPQAIASAFLK